MRWMRIFVFVIPMLGVVVYRHYQRSGSEVAAAVLVENSFAPSWSSNEQVVSSMEERLKQDQGTRKPMRCWARRICNALGKAATPDTTQRRKFSSSEHLKQNRGPLRRCLERHRY
jgi:hypothetical protein